jgi:hypothetical protein
VVLNVGVSAPIGVSGISEIATFRRKNEASTPMFIEAGSERNC